MSLSDKLKKKNIKSYNRTTTVTDTLDSIKPSLTPKRTCSKVCHTNILISYKIYTIP